MRYVCWIDETIYPGPDQEPDRTFAEMFAALKEELLPLTGIYAHYSAMLDTFRAGGVRYDPNAALRDYEKQTEKYDKEQKIKAAYLKQDKLLGAPPGTTSRIVGYLNDVNEHQVRRQVGKGNVAGKGPRSDVTFGRNGRKGY